MDIAKLFDIPKNKQSDGDLGVEIEVEGRDLPIMGGLLWRTDHDGSLVGESFEYVFKRPLTLNEAGKAMATLRRAYTLNKSTINDSVRCGVHVHVNVQKLSVVQLYNFITLYSIFEGVLLDYCGKGRNGNLFCLPLNKSHGVTSALRKAAKTGWFMDLYDDEYRYCALNVKALGAYGSVEFRALRGGADLNKVKMWYSMLLGLRDFSCKYEDPIQIIEECSMLGAYGLFEEVLCKISEKGMFDNTNNVKRKIFNGVRSAQAIAFACNWNKYKEGRNENIL